jgi:medium-chain acyl-[acyl-carrier-protein] hydrolase
MIGNLRERHILAPGEEPLLDCCEKAPDGVQHGGSESSHELRAWTPTGIASLRERSGDATGSAADEDSCDNATRSAWQKKYSTTGDGWFYRPVTRPQAKVSLFCFSYAGGAASTFRLWPTGLPSWVEVWAVELPGHGRRWREPPIRTIPALVEAFIPALVPRLRRPFAFFGHSMGAVLANETARALTEREGITPCHLFVSSRRPPCMPGSETNLHTLPDNEFIQEIDQRYGGVPSELLHSPELLTLLLPVLRADIAALETFHTSKCAALPCPISAFGGAQDRRVPRNHLEAWRDHTDGPFRVRMFPGGHFYMSSQRDALLADISATLAPVLYCPGHMAVTA